MELYCLHETMETVGVDFPYNPEELTDEYAVDDFFNASTFREALGVFATNFFAGHLFNGAGILRAAHPLMAARNSRWTLSRRL